MKSKIFKLVLSIGLAMIVALAPASLPLAAGEGAHYSAALGVEGNAAIKGKDEVIYAVLTPGGDVRALYAVNHFTLRSAGEITDYGGYTSVTNLTDTASITQDDDAVSVQTDAENFYYQGDMATTELPWIFDITYALNGVTKTPQELAGQSGKLEIHIETRQNTALNAVFYENYMLQISVTLDTQKCSDIKAAGATIANAGQNKIIAYTLMPGKDADISLSAAVSDFTMAGIDISAMPFSMDIELPDTNGMMKDFTKLADAISDLNDGVGALLNGAAGLKNGAYELKNGSSDIKNGLSRLSGNSGQLLQASSQISGALSQIASALDSPAGEMDLQDLAQLPQGLSQLAAGLDEISGGLPELKNAFAPAYAALDEAMQGISNEGIDEAQIMALYGQTDPSQYGLIDQLVASYTAGQIAKGTYDQVKGAFDAVGPAMDQVGASIDMISATLDDMSGQISDALSNMDMTQQLAQLSAGISELDGNYTAFHNGLMEYMKGVGELSAGYAGFHEGLSSFGNGIGKLQDGVSELRDGTAKLNEETAKIPDRLQEEIDDLLDPYIGSEFETVSFTSPKNEHTDLVQFVLKCDGIEKQEETEDFGTTPGDETIWDRFISLFTGKKDD